MAGILRSLISTAAGMPLGKSLRRYAPGVLGGTLRAIKAGKEEKKKKKEEEKEEKEKARSEAYLEKILESRGRSKKASPYSLPAYLRE